MHPDIQTTAPSAHTASLWKGIAASAAMKQPASNIDLLPQTVTNGAPPAEPPPPAHLKALATVPTPPPLALVTTTAPHSLDHARRLDFNLFPVPPRGDRGPLSTIPNVGHFLTEYGVKVRYDVIAKKLLITMPGYSGSADNFDNVALTQINSLAILNGMQLGPIPGSIEAIGDRNLYNPVAEWIESSPWDGTDRRQQLYATLKEQEGYPRELKETLIYRWLIGSVAAIFEESGFSTRGVLTLQGPQSIGKTKWAGALISDKALSKRVIKLAATLDATDKDSQLSAITHWIVEIGELDGSLRKDIAKLKGFLTAGQDKIRRPYGRADSNYARRTVFLATVNDAKFLVDPTGNTRFWTVAVSSIDYDHGIDMQQLYAQLLVEYRAGAQWWLTRDEERSLEAQNAQYRTESVIRERVTAILDLDKMGDADLRAYSATEILGHAQIERPTNPQMKECCAALRELGATSVRIKGTDKWRVALADRTSDFGMPGLPLGEEIDNGF